MSNVAYQKPSFDDQSIYQKATPVAPSENKGAARKADGAFRTISEVADELDVPQHVLRFWETKFTQVKLKRGGGRRYYRPEDVSLLKHIHNLLYTEGYTIKGVQKAPGKGQGKNCDRGEGRCAGRSGSIRFAATEGACGSHRPDRNAAGIGESRQPVGAAAHGAGRYACRTQGAARHVPGTGIAGQD